MASNNHVVVLGAGVIGLQTTLALLSRKVDVTLVSDSWPGTLADPHYTSMFSGAQWRSNPSLDDRRQQSWDRKTLLHWRHLVSQHAPTELGLELRRAEFLWDAPGPAYPTVEAHWWSLSPEFVPVRHLDPEECAAKGFPGGAGFAYETIAVNPSLYCTWLLRQCEEQGQRAACGTFETRTSHVGSLAQALAEVPGARAVVNCTGVAAGELAHDETCFPTKGQTVLVQGQAHAVVTRRNEHDGEEPWEALVIPRPGEDITMLGGCKIAGDWSTESSSSMTETIKERCRSLAPELLDENGKFKVVAVRVGLRPSRKDGARVEVEELADGKFIVHNYGHHSAGFEGSVGAAEEATSLSLDRLAKMDYKLKL